MARREASWREFEAAGSWSQSAARSDMWTSRASLKPASTQNSQENMVFAVNNTW